MKNILVTGGAGYIGSHTVVELIHSGYNPIIVDDFRNSDPIILAGIEKITKQKPIIYKIDICNKEALKKIFNENQIDGIIHFAAYKAVGESVAFPLKYYSNNLVSLTNVLECMLEFSVDKMVFSSSCTVYGEPIGIKEVTEDSPKAKPSSPYGNSKLISENIIEDTFVANPRLKTVCLRYFNPVGAHPSGLIGELPQGKPNNLLPFVTQTAMGKHENLTVFGNDYPTQDGTCIRDYIHVVDLAKAHVKAINYLENKSQGLNEAINIGTGKGSSVLEIIQKFEKISNQKLNWQFGERRSGDVVEIFANAKKSFEKLNWKAELTVDDAIKDAWNWEIALKNLNL
jgi:UDP-glucose 4-epimerase